jgi:hypothetical protein
MGAACEHFLYDKGYGPTNLTLKQYLHALFPEFQPPRPVTREEFPLVEPTLIPIGDRSVHAPLAARRPRGGQDAGRAPQARVQRRGAAARCSAHAGPQPAPGPRPRPRRLKTRLRPR